MNHKCLYTKNIKKSIAVSAVFLGSAMLAGGYAPSHQANARSAYDISQWQGKISNYQGSQLKREAPFMILRAEDGGSNLDTEFYHNARVMEANHIPYGAYDYSLYANPNQARGEATALYQRAPHAKFYVNDTERNNAGALKDASTIAWAKQIHQLTSKPAVLYSDMAYMNGFNHRTRKHYNAIWLAAYGMEPHPTYHYDLWQYTDRHYSPALGQRVDASQFPSKPHKPLSFWTHGKHRMHLRNYRPNRYAKLHRHYYYYPRKHHHHRRRSHSHSGIWVLRR